MNRQLRRARFGLPTVRAVAEAGNPEGEHHGRTPGFPRWGSNVRCQGSEDQILEESMKRPKMMFAILVGTATIWGTPQLSAHGSRLDSVLAEAMEDATISLQQGLT